MRNAKRAISPVAFSLLRQMWANWLVLVSVLFDLHVADSAALQDLLRKPLPEEVADKYVRKRAPGVVMGAFLIHLLHCLPIGRFSAQNPGYHLAPLVHLRRVVGCRSD